MHQRLLAAAQGGHHRGHILEVGFRCDALLHVVGAAPFEFAAVGGVLDDLLLLRRRDPPEADG